MKKAIFIFLFLPLGLMAQKKDSVQVKKDTTIQILMPLEQFRALLYTIDVNIDSKKASKELIDFLSKSASIFQPADKAKQ